MPTKKVKLKDPNEQISSKKHDAANVWQERIAELLVILLMCILPLYLGENRYIGLTGQKFWFFFWCMIFTFACVIAVWTYRLWSPPRILLKNRLSVIDWALIAFCLVTLISAIFSPFRDNANVWIGRQEPNGRYDGAITQLFYAGAFFIISKWYRPRQRDFILFGITVIIISLLGIFQFYGMDFFRLYPNHIPRYTVENFYRINFRSTLGNINMVSTYACVSVLLCGVLYIKSESRWRYLWLISCALGYWLMVLARSDSGVVGTVVAVAAAAPFIINSVKNAGRLLIQVSSCTAVYVLQKYLYEVSIRETMTLTDFDPHIAAAAVMMAAGLIMVILGRKTHTDAPPKWIPRTVLFACLIIGGIACIEHIGRDESITMIYQIREIMHGRIEDNYVSKRIYIWRNALEAFPNYPVIGTGPDTFLYALPRPVHEARGILFDKAHNEYLQILICQGVLGLAAYLVFIGGVLVKAVPKVSKDPLLTAAAVAFIGYCVQAFFNISLPIASQMMWVLAGVMVSSCYCASSGRNT